MKTMMIRSPSSRRRRLISYQNGRRCHAQRRRECHLHDRGLQRRPRPRHQRDRAGPSASGTRVRFGRARIRNLQISNNGIWDIGSLAVNDTATLTLVATSTTAEAGHQHGAGSALRIRLIPIRLPATTIPTKTIRTSVNVEGQQIDSS